MDKLPLEVIHEIGLRVEAATDLFSLSSTERRLLASLRHSRSFITRWLMFRHPTFAAMFSDNTDIVAGTNAMDKSLEGKVFEDATKLGYRLPLPSWRRYFECWLVSRYGRRLPVLPSDGSIRNALVVHAWSHVIPRFIRNQLMPPLDYQDASELVHIDVDDETDTCQVGPDLIRLFGWFALECSGDFNFMSAYETSPDVTTMNVLPEGLIDATRYAWLLNSFRPGWIELFLETLFQNVPETWEKWISVYGKPHWQFNDVALRDFKFSIKKRLDPWADPQNQQLWLVH